MANQTITADEIIVHGRGSLTIPYKVTSGGQQVDISAYVLFFEVSGAGIREALVPNPADPMGKLIIIDRVDVEKLKTTALNFALVDETNIDNGLPDVLWSGKISRNGYIGSPVI